MNFKLTLRNHIINYYRCVYALRGFRYRQGKLFGATNFQKINYFPP